MTRGSVVEALREGSAAERDAAADLLARAYWGPVVSALCARWRLEPADAEDLAQEFFAEALEKEWLARYDPAKARFRTFLRVCLDRFASNAARAGRRLKRGGGAAMVPLDDQALAAAQADDPEEHFRHEWVRSVFALALDALREEGRVAGKDDQVAIFEAYDVQDAPAGRPSYRDLAGQYAIPESTVTNHLAWARRAFRRHVLAVLRALAGSEAEYRADAQELLGLRDP